MSSPRRRDKFWMVTLADRKPEIYREDVPMYFPRKRDAIVYRQELERDPDNDDLLIVTESDEPWDAIAWPWLEGWR